MSDDVNMEMRKFLETVQTGQGNITFSQPQQIKIDNSQRLKSRIITITEHLYRHMQRITAEDISTVLPQIDSIYAAQTIDNLSEAIQQNNESVIIELSKKLDNYFSELKENDIASILGRNSYQGEDIDVYGLIQSLGNAINEHDNRSVQLKESIENNDLFNNLVNDLNNLINIWSKDSILAETGNNNGSLITPKTCINDLINVLKNNGF